MEVGFPVPCGDECYFVPRESGDCHLRGTELNQIALIQLRRFHSNTSSETELIRALGCSIDTGTIVGHVASGEGGDMALLIRSVVDVIKQSTVSTAHLKVFLLLQLRPINLVVYQGSLGLAAMQALSRGGLPA